MTAFEIICMGLLGSVLSLTAAKKPNFVIIFTDDQGYQDLGCYGSPDIATPNIDRMAAEGTRFTSFYAQTICGPSRTALMTSSYPLRVAQDKNRCEIHPVVHSKEITIAEILKPKGYKSAAFGKWDLATHSQKNWIDELLPRGQGFDYFFGTPTSNDSVVHLLRNEKVIERKADMSTLTRRYTDEALQFIEQNKEEPFFVYLAHTMPHTKLAVSKEFKGKSKGGFYGDVIEEIDHNTGRILKKIKDLGLDENTYIIFTSDNGPWLLRKAHGGHALPLRSGKTTCWEGGLRVPFIIRAPGRVPAGKTNHQVTATIDLMPSIAKLAGADLPSDRVLDGIDISNVWHGKQDQLNRPYFYYQHFYLRGVRKGDWKLMLKHEEGPKSATAKWKHYVAARDSKPLASHQLFNLRNDIGETTDLSTKHPEKLAELLKLADWARNDIGDFDRIGKNARFFDQDPKRIDDDRTSSSLPVSKGLFLDLDANRDLELEDGNRVKSWRNQIKGNAADLFVKQDEGRKAPGSGRPTLKRKVAKIGGNNTLVFEEQELINMNEDAFDHMVTGSGYTWLSVMCVYQQNVGKKDVNSFFGNLRNSPQYEGFWGNLMDDNRVWMGTRNGIKPKGKISLWHKKLNPCVVSKKTLVEKRYYLVMGRMGSGKKVVDLELFINSTTPVDRKTVPVNPNANPSKMAIGQERDAIEHPGKESFHGEISRFLIYNRPLADEELSSMIQSLAKTYRIEIDE